MILAEFKINSRKFSVGVVHLKAGIDYDIRRGEVQECMELLMDSDDSLLIGDFNFRESPDEPVEDNILKQKYLDLWQETHPGEDRHAATFNIEENKIAAIVSKMATQRTGRQGRSFRFDRMFCNSPKWHVTNMKLIGTTPIPEKAPNGMSIFISDHYGLEAEINFDS